jgi:RND family efflux transporter MFP subunit
MIREARVTVHGGLLAVAALVLVLVGAGATYLILRAGAAVDDPGTKSPAGVDRPRATAHSPQESAPASGPTSAPLADIVISLTGEAAERAGIVVAPVGMGASTTELRLPGVVEPNAYRQVAITPLVGGRVSRVTVELGQRVRRGTSMAELYSPELAEAHTRYVSARAMLDAHDRELQRTQKLVEIGAASRQELERVHAEHAAQTAAVQSARSQVELLGATAATLEAARAGEGVSATVSVAAPIDGIVTERYANVGLNVEPATKLFTVVDLSTVWVVADVYEKDLSRVRVGAEAAFSTAAYPGLVSRGRIGYIDPQVSPQTRTAKVRVEVPNPRGELRLGMYADVVITGAGGESVPLIPRRAVQNVGDRTVVYLADPKEPGRFVEREVRLGSTAGEQVEVAAGIQAGDTIVTDGSFFIRAERERLGLRPTRRPVEAPARGVSARTGKDASAQAARIAVTEHGFEPGKVTLRAGTPARLTFVRTTDKTCATEVVFASTGIKRALPLNEPVTIALTPAKGGDIAFACGLNMLKGVVVAQ